MRGFWIFALVLLAGCNQQPTVVPVADAMVSVDETWPDALPAQALKTLREPMTPLLDIGVVIFDPGIKAEDSPVFSAVRELEARLLAIDLRHTLTESGAWGAVRLLPERSLVAPLAVTARLIHSDGRDLVLEVDARDATGRVWLAQTLRGRVDTSSEGVTTSGADPFAAVWYEIANRLLAQWQSTPPAQRDALLDIAELRYAASLAPDPFAGYLESGDDRWRMLRRPAANDPMFARIDAIRDSELMFIDAIDEQYVDLQSEMGDTYAAWRDATRDRARWLENYAQRAGRRDNSARSGSFASLQSVYGTYRAVKVQEQDLFDYALGLRNETQPTVLDYEGRAVSLEGTLQARYRQWRKLLADIFRVEQGL